MLVNNCVGCIGILCLWHFQTAATHMLTNTKIYNEKQSTLLEYIIRAYESSASSMGVMAETAGENLFYDNFCCDNGKKYIILQEICYLRDEQ